LIASDTTTLSSSHSSRLSAAINKTLNLLNTGNISHKVKRISYIMLFIAQWSWFYTTISTFVMSISLSWEGLRARIATIGPTIRNEERREAWSAPGAFFVW